MALPNPIYNAHVSLPPPVTILPYLILHLPLLSLPPGPYYLQPNTGAFQLVNHSSSPHSPASCGELQTRTSICFRQKMVKLDCSPTELQSTTSGTKTSSGIHKSEGLNSQGTQNSLNKISDSPDHNFYLFVSTFWPQSLVRNTFHTLCTYVTKTLTWCSLLTLLHLLFGSILVYCFGNAGSRPQNWMSWTTSGHDLQLETTGLNWPSTAAPTLVLYSQDHSSPGSPTSCHSRATLRNSLWFTLQP